MSKKEKLIKKLKEKPYDYSFNEICTLLGMLGYELNEKGKTSGSRVCFVRPNFEKIMFHRPHPGNIVTSAAIKEIREVLKRGGLI